MASITERVMDAPWPASVDSLWELGYGRLGILLSTSECQSIRDLYRDENFFRSRIDMARYRFGSGEYKYFRYPLPNMVAELRDTLYPALRSVANPWMAALGLKEDFPPHLETFIKVCRKRGQARPTPLLLYYQRGDFNCLHQDVYGELVFPFQVIIGLSNPETEYRGGELLLVEQRPRAQSRGHVLRLGQGEAVAISTRYRPVKGSRGYYRANMRHGVSSITSGERYTLGIPFHDAT